MAALRKLSVATARVIRAGVARLIPARELVLGDLIQVEAGDRIPADSFLPGFHADEPPDTGSLPDRGVHTGQQICRDDLSNRGAFGGPLNMLFMSTNVVSGKGRALVTVATGSQTGVGKDRGDDSPRSAGEREETPLQRRLEQLGHTLLWLSLVIVAVVFLLGMPGGVPLIMMFLTSVRLSRCGHSRGPAVVTITLALGVTRMVQRHALIRRLPAVETLGSTTVIVSTRDGRHSEQE
ncbi:MAG: hypothetical protein U0231_12480 [Nitrospiraceae bacterium]